MKLWAYAKLNLFLGITGRREDGYHTLEMVMQSVDLHDTVEIFPADEIHVRCEGIEEQNNIAYKAAKLFFNESGISGGAGISVEKRIPQMAGMGGGSADAAAVLYGLNELYDRPILRERLTDISARLGADVPFALTGGCQAAKGLGEQLSPLVNRMDCFYLILKPSEGCSTPKVYALFDSSPVYPDKSAYGETLSAISRGDIDAFFAHTFNALTPAAGKLCPRIPALLAALSSSAGCLGSFMTGSGSACAGVFTGEAAAKEAAERLTHSFGDVQAFITRAVGRGVEIE